MKMAATPEPLALGLYFIASGDIVRTKTQLAQRGLRGLVLLEYPLKKIFVRIFRFTFFCLFSVLLFLSLNDKDPSSRHSLRVTINPVIKEQVQGEVEKNVHF